MFTKNKNKDFEIEIFKNEEFGEIRILLINDKPYFCANDVAKTLGYKRPADAVSTHCKGSVKYRYLTNGGEQETKFIPEGDVYRLITHSKLPSAEKFESWIFDEVLPTIRKTGGYISDDEVFINTYLPFADDNTKQLFKITLDTIKNQNNIIQAQKIKIETDEPLVNFATKVSDSTNLIDMGRMAKLLKDENIDIGRNRLFKWLRDKKILMENNVPYQQFMDSGYFAVKEYTYKTPYGEKTETITKVTGKGQIYITERLRKELLH